MFLQEQLKGIIIAFIFVFCTCVGIWTSDISVSVLGSRLMEEEQQHDTEMRPQKQAPWDHWSQTSRSRCLVIHCNYQCFKTPQASMFLNPQASDARLRQEANHTTELSDVFQCLEINAEGGIYEPRCVILRVLNFCRCVRARGFVSKRQQTRARFLCAGGW